MDDVMFFPRTMILVIPSLIFISLFFIPEGYTGWTKSTRTMNGTYQNKWLFDMIYVGALVVFIHSHINAFFNQYYRENRYKLVRYLNPPKPNKNKTDVNPIVIRIVFYFIFALYLLMMNIDASGLKSSSRWDSEFNRFVFLNFFMYSCLFYFSFLFLGIMSFITKADFLKGRDIIFKGDK